MENIGILLVVAWPLFNVCLLAAAIGWLVREFAVKIPRRRRWVAEHDGVLIGDEKFYDWCYENGIDPKYYF